MITVLDIIMAHQLQIKIEVMIIIVQYLSISIDVMMVIANIVLDLRADMLMRLLSYNEVICHKQNRTKTYQPS